MRLLLGTICFAVATGMPSAAYAARYYYAACFHESHGALGFSTRRHRDAADAEKDCAEHRKTYPRHRCIIQPIDY